MDKEIKFECTSCGGEEISVVYDNVSIHKQVNSLTVGEDNEIAWCESDTVTEIEAECGNFDDFVCNACGIRHKWEDGEFVETGW